MAIVGEPVELRAVGLDGPWLLEPDWRGRIRFHGQATFTSTDARADLPPSVSVSRDAKGRFEASVRFRTPGIHYVRVHDAIRPGVRGESNPVLVTETPRESQLYWGDMHVHSCYSDGIAHGSSLIDHGRNVSHLDYMALVDHSDEHASRGSLDAIEWADLLAQSTQNTEPGRFVVFPGFEWTSNTWGHRHVVYRDAWGETISCVDERYTEPSQLYAALSHRVGGALVIPHHANHGHVTSEHDPKLELLYEVYSRWGCSETCPHPLWPGGCGEWSNGHYSSYHMMLEAGYRMGAFGSGDSHYGHPGRIDDGDLSTDGCPIEVESIPNLPLRGGIGGVFASGLTRDGLFDGFVGRRTLATTGPRFLILFDVNGTPMGGEITDPDSPLVHAVVAGRTPMTVEVIRDGEVIHSQSGPRVQELEIRDRGFAPRGAAVGSLSYYYVRVIQEDDEWGWSSPVWVRP